jgi:hypothetical protein
MESISVESVAIAGCVKGRCDRRAIVDPTRVRRSSRRKCRTLCLVGCDRASRTARVERPLAAVAPIRIAAAPPLVAESVDDSIAIAGAGAAADAGACASCCGSGADSGTGVWLGACAGALAAVGGMASAGAAGAGGASGAWGGLGAPRGGRSKSGST